MSYRFSIIIRTFNRPTMLIRALESVAAQTWPDFEVVVVNDGGESVDAVVAPFREQMDLILREFGADEKPGRCLAATKGVEASSGNWIAYLDDDDVWYSRHLELMKEGAASSGKQVIYSDNERACEERQPDGSYAVVEIIPGVSEEFSRAGLYCGCYIHLSCFCHERSVFDRLGGFDPAIPVLEDFDLFLRYANHYEFHHVAEVTARYHVRDDQTNAITSMRKEFDETTTMLTQKHLHLAVIDVLDLLKAGRAQIRDLQSTVHILNERVAELERRQ